MAYASDEDVQIHLPVDKLKLEEIPDDYDKAVEDAERIVRGYLASVITTAQFALWVDPDNTPEQIRGVVGRLTAAKLYRVRYSEDALDDPEYAQNLYNEAMAMINGILGGSIIIPDIDVGTDFDNTFFEPNNNSIPPFFAMGARF